MTKRTKKKTSSLSLSGTTVDGKPVMSGVYNFHQSLGFPLELTFLELKDASFVPDWLDFYRLATDNGMGHDRIISKIVDEAGSVWGSEFISEVVDALNSIYDSGTMPQVLEHYKRKN